MADLSFHPIVTFRNMSKAERTQLSCGVHQQVFVRWPELPVGVSLVHASSCARTEFGPGVFRVGKGQMQEELIVKLDPWAGTIAFLDDRLFVEEGVIRWNPTKLQAFIVADRDEFLTAYRAPSAVMNLISKAHRWWATRNQQPAERLPFSTAPTYADATEDLGSAVTTLIDADRDRF
jgi:hypothetical protein